MGILIPLVLGVAKAVSRPAEADTESEKALAKRLERLQEESGEQWVKQFGSHLEVELTVPFSVTSKVVSGDAEVTVMDWDLRASTHQQYADLRSIDAAASFLRSEDEPSRLVILGQREAERFPGDASRLQAHGDAQKKGGHAGRAVPIYLFPGYLGCNEDEPAREPALIQWASSQMTQTYPWLAESQQDGSSLATELISKHKILLVLDGLDEIPGQSREYVFKVLSDAAKMQMPMIITCRPEEYASVALKPHRMRNTPVISLSPLPLTKYEKPCRASWMKATNRPTRCLTW